MPQSNPQSPYEALVLGVAQDGGVPHMACTCRNCVAAMSDPHGPQCAVSLALIHHPPLGSAATAPPPSEAWLIDCGPDIKQQWQMLQDHAGPRGCQIRGVFLTHLHMGHYIGLFQFGKEAAQARGLLLYCTASVAAFLGRNEPWRYYLDQGIFELVVIQPGEAAHVVQGLSITPLLVPHRQEFSDTVAYSIAGPLGGTKLFWCPDIDSWHEWETDIRDVVSVHTFSFLDATFYSPDELKRRDMGSIPHPLVTDTLERLKGLGDKVVLIHLNHTNPVWDKDSEQAKHVEACGFGIGRQGGAKIAEGSFSDASLHKSNFGQLRVTTLPGAADGVQMRAAGLLEGYLTAEKLSEHASNIRAWFTNKGNGTRSILDWLVKQDEWAVENAAAQVHASSEAPDSDMGVDARGKDNDKFWYAISLVLEQVQGIMEGYAARRAELQIEGIELASLAREDFLLINAMGDLSDLLPMFIEGGSDELPHLSPEAAWRRVVTSGHCSALIKVRGDLSDIFLGHNTWASYYIMVRLYKHYDFAGLGSSHAVGKRVSMSGYPGAVSSIDDFFIAGAPTHLAVMETTNEVLDTTLYRHVTYRAVLSWHRVFSATLLSSSGDEWVSFAKMHHSGTYNNQYMVVDLKHFTPGHELQPGLLTVLELLPGFSMSADVTRELERGFWPSYNVPYFPEVYERAGYPATAAALAALGPAYSKVVGGLSYQLAPRAKVFRRDAGSVDNVTALASLLRSNKWGKDSYTDNDVWGTLCARGDLDPARPIPYGCLDVKVTSFSMAYGQGALAVSGPSAEGGLPPFSWSGAKAFSHGRHGGMPDVYNGQLELQEP